MLERLGNVVFYASCVFGMAVFMLGYHGTPSAVGFAACLLIVAAGWSIKYIFGGK